MNDLAAGRVHVVVTGPMGSGKTTIARAVADRLALPRVDNDTDIETAFGSTGAEIAATHGVEALHRAEAAVLIGALARSERSVIAAAGSVIDDDLAVAALARRAAVFWLDLDLDEQLRRAASGRHRRPIDRSHQRELNLRRAEASRHLGWTRIDATESPPVIAERLAARIT